ncbi:MAG: type II toxin-antitoxin system ParD family antitoxin [Merismopedia sp. SIO2A8]|nr:type II toxin-antitoxin system ParD family antitoxin [Symploca sp. SIO2B6]NET54190.1 type II toxin-antitoxin system ParD family antitoxin [Merismopedia sp. SIO2A8]
MNVSLTPELEKLVQEKVKSGLYNSASEVIREALRLLSERDHLKELRLQQLRQEIDKGIKQLETNECAVYDGESLNTLAEEIKSRGRKNRVEQHLQQ